MNQYDYILEKPCAADTFSKACAHMKQKLTNKLQSLKATREINSDIACLFLMHDYAEEPFKNKPLEAHDSEDSRQIAKASIFY